MTNVLIAVGSNEGKESNIPAAVDLLDAHPQIHVLAQSPAFATPAIGPDGLPAPQPEFHNAALLVETDLDPGSLQTALRAVEHQLGRVRTADKFAARPIDLDIAYYGDTCVELDGKRIPDGDVLRFAHVAIPLAAVAPEWRHPETGESLSAIAAHLA